jgi:hypothetical protein
MSGENNLLSFTTSSNGKAFTALGATTIQDSAAIFGFHTHSEAMLLISFFSLELKGN